MFNTSFIYNLRFYNLGNYKKVNVLCTALVVGSDDVASSYCIGVLMGRLAGRREGSRGARVVASLLSWCAPISSTPEPAVTGLKMKSPDVNPGDQVIGDRRNKDIAEDEGR